MVRWCVCYCWSLQLMFDTMDVLLINSRPGTYPHAWPKYHFSLINFYRLSWCLRKGMTFKYFLEKRRTIITGWHQSCAIFLNNNQTSNDKPQMLLWGVPSMAVITMESFDTCSIQTSKLSNSNFPLSCHWVLSSDGRTCNCVKNYTDTLLPKCCGEILPITIHRSIM